MNYEIKNRWTGAVIFSLECGSLKICVEAAVKQRVSLSGSNLRDSDLRSANLRDSDLSSADLRSANLRGSDLSGSDLRSANLRSANLRSANLRDSDLRDSDLSSANLRDSDLSSADLRSANLRGSDLSGSDLRSANLQPIKDDFFAVLSHAPAEVPALIAALDSGRVNGSTYTDGECGCLVGTLAIASGADAKDSHACERVDGLVGDSLRPAERFFLSINLRDTPANSQHANLAREWAQQWLDRMRAVEWKAMEAK